MVDFACDASGSPILALSDLAVHSKVNTKISIGNVSQFLLSYLKNENFEVSKVLPFGSICEFCLLFKFPA